jgi:protein-tyrosine phosphatase
MQAPGPTPQDTQRHRAVYARPGLPAFAMHEFDDRLLAGRNPLTVVDVAQLCAAGVTHVLDLREDAEWAASDRFGVEAIDELRRRGVERKAIRVVDQGAPSPEFLDAAVAWIEEIVARAGTRVYVHCRAGRERTAAVLAALLVSRGVSLADALRRVRERCRGVPMTHQVAAVRAWAAARGHADR